MNAPRWIDKRALLYLHAESLAEHGGAEGLRDEGLPDSALARPLNRLAYANENGACDLAELAAAYAAGIAQNRPFVDGNKRAALLAAGLFLALNGQSLRTTQVDATHAMLALAAGQMSERDFSAWLRGHLQPRD